MKVSLCIKKKNSWNYFSQMLSTVGQLPPFLHELSWHAQSQTKPFIQQVNNPLLLQNQRYVIDSWTVMNVDY